MSEKNIAISVILSSIIVSAVFGGLAGYLVANVDKSGDKITSFEDCVAAGNPVMESYPEQCRTKDGRLFVRDISGDEFPQGGGVDGNAGGIQERIPEFDTVEKVRALVVIQHGVSADEIMVPSVEGKEWPNACLGLPAEDEMCAEVITSGYEVTVQFGGEVHVYRTNEDGSQIRQK